MPQNPQSDSGQRRARLEYPEDRFDRIVSSGRVGAHRVHAKQRYLWHYVIAGVLSFAVLATLGILAVNALGSNGATKLSGIVEATSTPQKTVAVLDPSATIAVINGSDVAELASSLDEVITQNQWGTVLFSGSAQNSDVKISAVFYLDARDAGAADALAAKLGGISSYETQNYDEYGARLIVLLGADYSGPGLEEAKQKAAAAPVTGDSGAADVRENGESGSDISQDAESLDTNMQ